MKKILVPGGTGAMGTYLVPELRRLGYKVDVISLEDAASADPDLRYFKADFSDNGVMEQFLQNDYDAIIDFMLYKEAPFLKRMDRLMTSTGHYIGLSTYRVYADCEHPITERSPRLMDVMKNPSYIRSDDEYSLYKARIENAVIASKHTNWTFLRPSVTFSKRRFQLVTLEADSVIGAAKNELTLLLPRQAMQKQATITWAGDVAKMVSRLLFNKQAMREIYHPATSEHNTWETIAGYYKDILGLKYAVVDKDEYLWAITDGAMDVSACWQLEYDRLFDRVMDNSKILNITGMKQSELTPVYEALKAELAALPKNAFSDISPMLQRIRAYCLNKGIV